MPSDTRLPILRPLLPPATELMPYLEKIDAARWYTNHGALVRAFEARLAEKLGVHEQCVVTSSNGTAALTQCLRALSLEPGSLCAMPSWTFVATPAAAVSASLRPHFCDVDPLNWELTPEIARRAVSQHRIAAIVTVAPFGAPAPSAEWDAFVDETGIPVVIDAAASIDAYFEGLGTVGRCATMISLHATKTLGVGEGAVVLSRDKALAQAIRLQGNFGFFGTRDAAVAGTNAKLSEYTAAIGLAGLDRWLRTRDAWSQVHRWFIAELAEMPALAAMPGFGEGWISSYGNVVFATASAASAASEALEKANIDTRRWWGDGCHRQTAYRDCAKDKLDITEDLASRVLGLPLWIGMERTDVKRMFAVIRTASNGPTQGSPGIER